MARAVAAAGSLATLPVCQTALGEPGPLLKALFKSSTVGVAICDREFRFCAVNDALASMNGIPAAAHLGKTIHAVLGRAAAKIEPAFDHVFATGQPLSNFKVTATLPSRKELGQWDESYFPISDDTGRVHQVGVIVLELTRRYEVDAVLSRLTQHLTRGISELRRDSANLDISRSNAESTKSSSSLLRSAELMETCLSEVRCVSELLQNAPSLGSVLPTRASRIRKSKRDFAIASPIEEELEYPSLLSPREQEVVALLATGQTNKEVGTRLAISTRTVETYRARIMFKLGTHSLTGLVRYAVRANLIDL